MRLLAANAGGTGVDRTPPTSPVAAGASSEAEEPEASARVSLVSTSIVVQRNGVALVKLGCAGAERCEGKLTLTASATSKAKGGKRHSHTITIGTLKFGIPPGGQTTVKLKLNKAGHALLDAHNERLSAHLAILELEAGLTLTHSRRVLLREQKPRKTIVRNARLHVSLLASSA
jgi:hypothetical protein